MLKKIIPTSVAVGFGLLILLGTFFPVQLFVSVRVGLTEWAMVIGAFAFILAYANLLRVHLTRLKRFGKGSLTSLLVVLSALAGLALVILQSPTGQWPQFILNAILIPGESALLAITAVTLILAGIQIMHTHRNVGSFLFLFVVVIFLLSAIPYRGDWHDVAKTFQVLSMPGMRGLVLGSALGITMTGLRIIFGVDHPHSDE